MALLDVSLNQGDAWNGFRASMVKRVEVDLNEVERVIELAKRTPGLSRHEEGLQKLLVFFAVATQFYRDNDPNGLVSLLSFWERYRAAILQRNSNSFGTRGVIEQARHSGKVMFDAVVAVIQ